jgi:hypothetical protein
MAGLDPAIHVLATLVKAWMPGTRPGMTEETTARVTSRAPGSQNIAYSCACRHIATEDALARRLAPNLERASVQTQTYNPYGLRKPNPLPCRMQMSVISGFSAVTSRLQPTNPWLIGDPSVYYPRLKTRGSQRKSQGSAREADRPNRTERFFLLQTLVTH